MKLSVDWSTVKAGKRHNLSNPITAAFKAIEKSIYLSEHELTSVDDADVVFVFGSITQRKMDTDRARSILKHRINKKKIIALDSAFFSTYIRNHLNSSETFMFRVGLGDCTGVGDFLNENSTNDRYDWFKEAFKFEEKEPQANNDAPILFILQSEKGWQYDNKEPYYLYARGVIDQLRRLTTRKIILRGHPNIDRHPIQWIGEGFDNIEYSSCEPDRRSLFSDLSRSGCVVTHSSSSAIESYVEGIPAFTLDPRCVVYKETDYRLGKINDLSSYNWNNRKQILANWAYTSWHVTEMENPAWLNYYLKKLTF